MNIQAKLIIYGVAVLLAVASIWGLYDYVDNKGYQRAAVAYQAQIDTLVADYKTKSLDELHRQLDANTAAKTREADAIAADDAKELEIQNLRKELADAASKDPDARKPALNADSVRRVNKVH
jgi:hypothetical protein